MSGGCTLKTCWKTTPDFRMVGKVLKQQFKKALMVNQSNQGNRALLMNNNGKSRNKFNSKDSKRSHRESRLVLEADYNKRLDTSLLYYQKSPNFCERDQKSDIPGINVLFTNFL